MNKSKNVMYHCSKCGFTFPVKRYIAQDMIKLGKKAFCPRCNLDKFTNRDGDHIVKTRKIVTSMSSPPSESQNAYIKGLGGDPNTVKTKREAGELIGKLKKQQEA